MTSGDSFHLHGFPTQPRIHEGERFPLHDIVYDKTFASGNVFCHPVIELSEASHCHQV